MENQKGGLKFDDALKFVQPRPWLVDDLGNPKTYPTNDIFLIKIFKWVDVESMYVHNYFISADAWKSRLKLDDGSNKRSFGAHKCAAIFIDNSGVDVILGILPFAEHLLSRGTEVCN